MSHALSDEVVISLRTRHHSGDTFDYQREASVIGVSSFTLGKAMRGLTHKHLNDRYPPVRKQAPKFDQTEAILNLHNQNIATDEICRRLRVGKNTVTRVVRSLNEMKRQEQADKKARVIALFLAGEMNIPDIAKQEGITDKTVYHWCRPYKADRITLPARTYSKRAGTAPLASHPYLGYRMYHNTSHGEHRIRMRNENGDFGPNISLRRYHMEVHLGRLLTSEETVVRIDGPSDDLSNLKLVLKADLNPKDKFEKICQGCQKPFTTNVAKRKVCSRECIGVARQGKPAPRMYTCKCEICEENFTSTNRKADLCSKASCIAIVDYWTNQ